MKKSASLFALVSLIGLIFQPFLGLAQSASEEVVLSITGPSQVKTNEAFNVTVTAKDGDGVKVPTYEGTVFFYENTGKDKETDITMPKFEYTFLLSDQGEHVFQKGFTLKKPGTYKIAVSELESSGAEEDPWFEITATDDGSPGVVTGDIAITDPADQTTIRTSETTVSGTGKATSTVNILLDGTKVATTQTDESGEFSAEVTGLKVGNNILTAEILDGTGTVISTSSPITLRYSTDVSTIDTLTIKEGDEFFAGSSVTFVAVGDANLKTVQVKVGTDLTELTSDPTTPGTYTGVYRTSEFEGEFNAGVVLTTQLNETVEVKNLAKFRTITGKIENLMIESQPDKKVRFTFTINPDHELVKYFKIKYGNTTGIYNKEATTYEKASITKDGQYTWYVPDIGPGEYFSTVVALDANKTELPITSGEQTFTIPLDAAPICQIDQVSGLRVERSGTYSVLTWDSLAEATKYQVFKRGNNGDFVMIDEVATNQYRVNIDMTTDQEVYEDFQIRGICKNGDYTGEGAFSGSVKVQTGPAMMILMALILASGVSFILIRRGYLD